MSDVVMNKNDLVFNSNRLLCREASKMVCMDNIEIPKGLFIHRLRDFSFQCAEKKWNA